MKNGLAICAALENRLREFGNTAETQAVVARACRANRWFRPDEVVRAAEAIRHEMLDADKLAQWVGAYSLPVEAPLRVLVVMAGNIPLVGFFDLLCVLMSGHRCLVKPSGKDRVLMEYVVHLLRTIEPEVPVEITDGGVPVDAAIATGSDNANRYFRARYKGLPVLLRGNRHSVAVLSGRETDAQLDGLADDLFAYSGLGCRNVSLLFLPLGMDLRLSMPQMNPKYLNNYRQTRALLEMDGTRFIDLGSAVAVEDREFPRALSRISYVYYDRLAEVEAWLEAHDSQLQCVVSQCLDHPRRVDFGRAQRPGLTDYPDAMDVMEFLSRLR